MKTIRLVESKGPFYKRHSLSLAAVGTLLLWCALYWHADPETHWGAFFGNAIADWSGVVVMVVGTKFLFEAGSAESEPPPRRWHRKAVALLVRHSLTVFLLVTGAAWVAIYVHFDPSGKWNQVVGNIVSEWTQTLGLVLLTKRLIEPGSKESK